VGAVTTDRAPKALFQGNLKSVVTTTSREARMHAVGIWENGRSHGRAHGSVAVAPTPTPMIRIAKVVNAVSRRKVRPANCRPRNSVSTSVGTLCIDVGWMTALLDWLETGYFSNSKPRSSAPCVELVRTTAARPFFLSNPIHVR
jgi:hypothetical protein